MKNKCLSILLCAILVVYVTGCGKSKTKIPTKVESNSNSSINSQAANTLVGKISASNYGDTINYSANGISDWKIFYNDGENVFIIASELIPNSKVPDSTGIDRNNRYLSTYNVIWNWDSPEFKKYAGVSSIDKNLAKKYQLNWIEEYPNDTEHYNMKVVASLFDQNNWSSFVDSNYADSAIGSPTVEMFINSWNAKHPDSKVYFSMGDENGYAVGTEENPTTNSAYPIEGFKEDKLYNTTPEEFSGNGMGMTLASPSMRGDDRVGDTNSTGIGLRDPFGDYEGVRPVVCLKADVNATYKNGIWELDHVDNSNSNSNSNSNENNTSSQENTTSFQVGNDTVQYGTYKGESAAEGHTLVLNSDNTALYDGKSYTFTVERYDFSQDASSNSYRDAIVLKNADGTSYFGLYVSNGILCDGIMVFVYSGK